MFAVGWPIAMTITKIIIYVRLKTKTFSLFLNFEIEILLSSDLALFDVVPAPYVCAI